MSDTFAASAPSGVVRALLAVAAIACLIPSAGWSQSAPEKLVRTLMERVDIPGGDEELRLFKVTIAPGYSVPPHAAKVVKAGGSFQDEASKTHVVFKNGSPTDVLKFLCATKIKKGEKYLLPE
jgi:hypothetical protein